RYRSAVEGNPEFDREVRRARRDVVLPRQDQPFASLGLYTHGDFDTCLLKALDPAASDVWVRVTHADDYTANTGVDDRLDARGRLAVVIARLDRHVECCPFGLLSGLLQRD